MRALSSIAADVDRGWEIVTAVAKMKEEFKAIEERLKRDALDRPDQHMPLADAEREGRKFIAHGTLLALPIVLTADKIVMSFAADSDVHKRIEAASDGRLAAFYAPKTTWEAFTDKGKDFRRCAKETLGDKAPAFITACLATGKGGIPKSDIKCEWTQAAAAAAKEAA